jgi:hypothetical protein
MKRQWYNTRCNDKPKDDVIFCDCGNPQCRRTMLELTKYTCPLGAPSRVEAERIHSIPSRRLQGVTILCTCGHFTKFI